MNRSLYLQLNCNSTVGLVEAGQAPPTHAPLAVSSRASQPKKDNPTPSVGYISLQERLRQLHRESLRKKLAEMDAQYEETNPATEPTSLSQLVSDMLPQTEEEALLPSLQPSFDALRREREANPVQGYELLLQDTLRTLFKKYISYPSFTEQLTDEAKRGVTLCWCDGRCMAMTAASHC